MREQRSAILDVLSDAPAESRSGATASVNPILERPLSSRLPSRGRSTGSVLFGGTSVKPGSAACAGGSGSFFRACILLLLEERPAHGYDILERLAWFGFDSGDSGWLYRTLRAYEGEAVLQSTWQISASGPPRRVYGLTDEGRDLLDVWAGSLRASKRGIDEFLERHRRAVGPRPGEH
ncbi:MAG: hypothetical protein NVS9B8_05390 [Candidatus Limnocylindrales bacterium]